MEKDVVKFIHEKLYGPEFLGLVRGVGGVSASDLVIEYKGDVVFRRARDEGRDRVLSSWASVEEDKRSGARVQISDNSKPGFVRFVVPSKVDVAGLCRHLGDRHNDLKGTRGAGSIA